MISIGLGREVFEELARCSDMGALNRAVEPRLRSAGMTLAGYSSLYCGGGFRSEPWLFYTGDAGPPRSMQVDPEHRDPLGMMTFRSTRAFTWGEAAATLPSIATERYVAAARAQIAPDALITPIRTGADEVGALVMLSSSPLDLDDWSRSQLQLLAEAYAFRGLVLLGRAFDGAPFLTQRESDALGLAVEGRSETQIAQALGISPHTAHDHMERLKARLGVRTRAEMAVRAAMLGLLAPALI